MPKLGCNGFSLFAEQMRPSLEELKGKKLAKFNDLISAAGPYWQTLPEDEKRDWKDRARHYKRSDTYHAKKKHQRMRGLDAKQRKMNGEDGRAMRSSSFGSEGVGMGRRGDSDLVPEEADSQDPMELPGPVSRWRGRPTRPHPPSYPYNHPPSKEAPMKPSSNVKMMEVVDGSPSMVMKALGRLGLTTHSARLLPSGFPPSYLVHTSEEDEWSSGAEEMFAPAAFALPRPLCTCRRPQRRRRPRKGGEECGRSMAQTQSSSLNDADVDSNS